MRERGATEAVTQVKGRGLDGLINEDAHMGVDIWHTSRLWDCLHQSLVSASIRHTPKQLSQGRRHNPSPCTGPRGLTLALTLDSQPAAVTYWRAHALAVHNTEPVAFQEAEHVAKPGESLTNQPPEAHRRRAWTG